jgi:peptidoglycan/LPS O-acetylase OafA/YrhL
VFAARVAGVPLALANEYVVLVAAPLAFLLFVPATVRLFVDHPHTTLVGLLAAAAFAPINNISVHPVAHPASQAILLFAFVLYLTLAVAAGALTSRSRSGRGRLVGGSALLALAGASMVFVHPQQGLNLAGFLGGMAALQAVARRTRPEHSIADTRSLLPHTALVGGVFLLWAPQFERVRGALVVTFGSLIEGGGTGAAVVADKSTSLTSVGGSLLEVFLKLFGVAAVLSLLAAAVFLLAARRHRRRPLLLLIAAGLVPVGGVFLAVFAAGMGDQYFRYQGFLMVPVTVVGAVGLLWAVQRLSLAGGERAGLTVAVVLMLVLTPAGLVALHSSPYVYKPTQHVTATGIDGHAAAFEHRAPAVPFTGLRGGPRRYVDYHYGTERARERLAFPGYRQGTPPSVFLAANYSAAFGEPRYLVTTEATRVQETELYDGFRYPERGFRALTRTPGIDRVRASDGFWLYYADGGDG